MIFGSVLMIGGINWFKIISEMDCVFVIVIDCLIKLKFFGNSGLESFGIGRLL